MHHHSQQSSKRAQPFENVIPSNKLLESHLFGFHDHSCVFLFTPHHYRWRLRHVVIPRRRRDADASAVVRRAGSLNRDRNLRADDGSLVLPPPAFSVRFLVLRCHFCPF